MKFAELSSGKLSQKKANNFESFINSDISKFDLSEAKPYEEGQNDSSQILVQNYLSEGGSPSEIKGIRIKVLEEADFLIEAEFSDGDSNFEVRAFLCQSREDGGFIFIPLSSTN